MISTQVLLADDQGRCWSGGDAGDGRLGRGGASELAIVEGVDDIKGVAAGACHSLAFTSKGTLYAWGLASDGRLGFTTEDASAPPTRVALEGVVDASAGKYHSLVVASEGVVFAFGDNSYGLCGNQNFTARSCSMAWWCRFLTARRSQRGHVISMT